MCLYTVYTGARVLMYYMYLHHILNILGYRCVHIKLMACICIHTYACGHDILQSLSGFDAVWVVGLSAVWGAGGGRGGSGGLGGAGWAAVWGWFGMAFWAVGVVWGRSGGGLGRSGGWSVGLFGSSWGWLGPWAALGGPLGGTPVGAPGGSLGGPLNPWVFARAHF